MKDIKDFTLAECRDYCKSWQGQKGCCSMGDEECPLFLICLNQLQEDDLPKDWRLDDND